MKEAEDIDMVWVDGYIMQIECPCGIKDLVLSSGEYKECRCGKIYYFRQINDVFIVDKDEIDKTKDFKEYDENW